MFWEEFAAMFGEIGSDPRGFYCLEVGNSLPGITPDNVGELTPTELVAAHQLFDARYRG